jgi:hypothetical protein
MINFKFDMPKELLKDLSQICSSRFMQNGPKWESYTVEIWIYVRVFNETGNFLCIYMYKVIKNILQIISCLDKIGRNNKKAKIYKFGIK